MPLSYDPEPLISLCSYFLYGDAHISYKISQEEVDKDLVKIEKVLGKKFHPITHKFWRAMAEDFANNPEMMFKKLHGIMANPKHHNNEWARRLRKFRNTKDEKLFLGIVLKIGGLEFLKKIEKIEKTLPP